jgi:molybdopterin converting factor small subunit
MSILIKLYGDLREKVKDSDLEKGLPITLNIEGNNKHTILDILDKFNIEGKEISHIFVNGKYCGPGKEVRDGDRVGLFPKKMALMFVEIPNLNSIYVTVKLFANLRKYGVPKSVIEIPEGSTIKSVLKKVKIPKEEKKLIFMVNGLPKYDRNLVIKDKDTLAIFPPIGGG